MDFQKLELTFLAYEQCFGEGKLDILKDDSGWRYRGNTCAATDFAILLGQTVGYSRFINEEESLKNRAVGWWIKPVDNWLCEITPSGDYYNYPVTDSGDIGARPAFHYSSISSIQLNKVRGTKGILEVEYGEYPQTVVSEDFAEYLERAYLNRTISETGKTYTSVNGCRYLPKKEPHVEYEYNGKKYIRFEANRFYHDTRLSDGRVVQKRRVYWVEVEPIRWMIDEKTNIALSKKVLFSGVKFNYKDLHQMEFEKTDIYKFLNECFSEDMIPSNINRKLESEKLTDFAEMDLVKAVERVQQEIRNTKAENDKVRDRLKLLEQLLQILEAEKEEERSLLAREAELNAKIEQKNVGIVSEGKYDK